MVFGPLKCSVQMDKLAKECYRQGKSLYTYKNTVKIPVLGMVDDILAVSKCGPESIKANSTVNSFIESKQLKFGENKCHKLHIGEELRKCPDLKVHNDEMKAVEKDKYLGDILTENGNQKENIENRRSKGFGIVAEILSILNEVPFGKFRIQAGLKLRNAMFLNGIPTNSEVWHGVQESDITKLEEVDEHLLRGILKAPSKTPIETLYLETGSKPIRFIIKSRRLGYLHHILTREKNELISRVFYAQKRKSIKGDWVKYIEEDFSHLDIKLSDSEIMKMKKKKFKSYIKEKIEKVAYNYLNDLKEKHSKVKHIQYRKLEIQKYMHYSKFTLNDIKLLFKLRTRMTQVKRNFKSAYSSLTCNLCQKEEEDQVHLLSCPNILSECIELRDDTEVEYEDLFSDVKKQLKAVKLFDKVFKARDKLLAKLEETC